MPMDPHDAEIDELKYRLEELEAQLLDLLADSEQTARVALERLLADFRAWIENQDRPPGMPPAMGDGMMIPTILNGTGKQNLLKELEVAHAAVNAAIDALQQVTVHVRDYHRQGNHAYTDEMDARLAALSTVAEDLLNCALGLLERGLVDRE